MALGRSQHDGYDPVALQHPDFDTPRMATSTDTADTTRKSTDAPSVRSTAHLRPIDPRTTGYPPVPSRATSSQHVRTIDPAISQAYDAERAQPPYDGLPYGAQPPQRPDMSHNNSWDLLAGIKKFEHSYEGFDSRNASEAHLAFADGDVPKNKARQLF